MWPKLEKLIDEMKKLGPHSLDGAGHPTTLNISCHSPDLLLITFESLWVTSRAQWRAENAKLLKTFAFPRAG